MQNLSIKQKLLIAFFLISLVPFFIISHLNVAVIKESIFYSEIQKLLTGANLTAEKINSFITSNVNSISRESQFPTYMAYIEADSSQRKDLIKHMTQLVKLCSQKQFEIFVQQYFITDGSGEVIFSSDPSINDASFSNYPFFEDTFKSGIPQSFFFKNDKHSGIYFSAPVRNEKKDTIGLLCIKYNFSVIQHLASTCNDIAGEGSFVMIINNDGICLASGKYPELIMKKIEDGALKINGGTDKNGKYTGGDKNTYSESDTYKFNNENYHYAGDLLIKNKPCKVFFLQPAFKFYAVVGKQLDMILILTLFIALISFTGAWYFWKKITDPIENLTRAVKNFSLDSPGSKAEIISNDEIGLLAQSFNQMSERLKSALDKLKESEKIWQFALIGSGDGVWDWDIKTNKIFLSERWKEMFGHKDIGDYTQIDKINTFVHEEDIELMNEKINKCLTGETEAFFSEFRLRDTGGKYRWVLARGSIVSYDESGRPARFVGISSDITARKEAEENYKKARDLAEKANDLKTQFLANMSHEIRTPMNGIIGFTKLLLMGELKNEQKEYIEIIKISSEHLLNIINDILDFSKLEAGKFKIENMAFNMDDLISKIIDFAKPLFINKNVIFETAAAEEIRNRVIVSDPQRLQQILINLISNAVKFTERGKVKLYIEKISSASGKKTLRFTVSDTGIGIKPDKMNEIFKAFHQLDGSYTKKFAGTGLGLAIVKELVNLMGGSIGVKSEYDGGSEFFFDIPLIIHENCSRREPAINESPNVTADNYKGMKALVADDDRTSQLLIKTLLESRGFEIEIADNGRTAIEIFNKEKFDLIIMDIQMPDIDGITAIKAIRVHDEASGKKTPIIVASAYAGKDEQKSFADCGADDCISKPIEFELFWTKVKRYLDK